MNLHLASLTHTDFPVGSTDSRYYPIGSDQCDYPLTDTFEFQREVGRGPLCGKRVENSSTFVPSFLHGHPSGFMPPRTDAVAPPPGLASGGFCGNHAPQTPANQKFIQTPRFTHSNQSLTVCPTPSSLPSAPYMTIGTDGEPYPNFLLAADQQNQLPLFACDHANCYPPSDVGYLSRRFPENQHWIRARASAVASLPHMRRGIYSLPIEVLEMIPKYFPVIDQLISLGAGEAVLQTCQRHKVFVALSATSKRLWRLFYIRSWETKVTPRANDFRAMNRFLNQVKVPMYTLFIERLMINLPRESMGLLRDCLMGLPCLHTLGIANEDEPIEWDAFKSISRVKLGFPNITKVAIPIFAHPILALLPKVEEIIFFCSVARDNASPALRKLRKPNVQERSGKIEPVLKSITIVSPAPGLGCAPVLVRRFPRLRKLCLSEPSKYDMMDLRGLKELTDFEIILIRKPGTYDLDSIKATAIQILQASECHKICACDRKCGCAKTNECYKCKPPKRFLRIKKCPGATEGFTGVTEGGINEECCVEEIQVLPKGTSSVK